MSMLNVHNCADCCMRNVADGVCQHPSADNLELTEFLPPEACPLRKRNALIHLNRRESCQLQRSDDAGETWVTLNWGTLEELTKAKLIMRDLSEFANVKLRVLDRNGEDTDAVRKVASKES